jgi:membrane-bound lytic murein transglycosylase D
MASTLSALVVAFLSIIISTAAHPGTSVPTVPAAVAVAVTVDTQTLDPPVELPAHPPRVLKLDLTRSPNDIWDRLRRGFAMPDLDSPLVIEKQLFYLNRPGFLKQVFERGSRYLYHIVDELERRGMPMELALLPMVESNYNPMAYSRSRASGLWQFIPSTGRYFNLAQNNLVDERRDVIASTNAALDYLQAIYEMHGDWHLALASYNWGEGAVARALKYNIERGLPAEYAHLRMPDETRNYIPKLQALKNIVARPELFGFELPHVLNRRHFAEVEAPKGIDLVTAAGLAGMSLDDFIALNPGYNLPVVTSSGTSLVVPVDRLAPFNAGLTHFAGTHGRWKTHQIKRGETLWTIAKRHGLPVSHLREINGLNGKSRIRPGHTLIIPDGMDPAEALRAARILRQTSVR